MIHSGNHEKGQNMQIMRLAAIVLAAVCGIAAAGSKQPETFDVWLRAGVQIDETGHVQDLQWEEQSKVHAVIAERLADRKSVASGKSGAVRVVLGGRRII